MFDYVNRMQLALGDKARRAGMKAGAGVALLIGAGFLLAALWGWLAWHLALGPALASLILGGGFALIGVVIWLLSGAERHTVPTTDDLRQEVEARLSLAADAAIDKVKFRAETAVDEARAKVSSLFGMAPGGARKAADQTGEDTAGQGAGIAAEALSTARETLDRAVESRAGPGLGLAGAFALGLVLAHTLSNGGRSADDPYDDDDDWPYDDD